MDPQSETITTQKRKELSDMSWHEIYDKFIAPIRDFIGLLIYWIDRIFWPWTTESEEEIS